MKLTLQEGTTNADAPSPTAIALAGSKAFFRDGDLRTHAGGAVELAFNHNDSDVIVETNVAAEVCRAVKDLNR